ncbi:MAG TPA: hypothetical protein VK083_02935 [Nocardia sp.]|uniref:hypothetical protein n=1 Tax=Nocardia TaxID=1817 RepID=UPI0024570626|nr:MULTISPECIES: hypothetical protein [Nocardia]HLS75733.1 hypothetical protein [Nocardia sp.]
MRYVDALFVAAFGVMVCIAGFGFYGSGAVVAVLIGLASVGYSGYIALGRGGYFMHDAFYALPILGGIVLYAGLS